MRILVTGAAGFIGSALCRGLVQRGHAVLGVTRRPAAAIPEVELRPIGRIDPSTAWSRHLDGIDVVLHLANRAHRSAPGAAEDDEAPAARALAQSAGKAGVRRVVYLSSVRVMGDATPPGAPFRGTELPNPRGVYGHGKLAIEQALLAASQESGMDIVILRPPLVYGPGVKANFRRLMWLVASGLPLPLAGICNRRSLIFIDNLVDLLGRAIAHPNATRRVLLARDAVDLSTPELIQILGAALGRPPPLFEMPFSAPLVLRRLPMLGPSLSRLTLSLQVDDARTRRALDWQPSVSPEIGLAATARAFRDGS